MGTYETILWAVAQQQYLTLMGKIVFLYEIWKVYSLGQGWMTPTFFPKRPLRNAGGNPLKETGTPNVNILISKP